jgi:hypothetical protein
MAILKRVLPAIVFFSLVFAGSAETPQTPSRVPVSLFPSAERVWLYSEPPQPIDEMRGAPINAGARFHLTEGEVQQLRDAVYELDLRTVSDEVVVGDFCIHPLKYVFGFEDAHGQILGFFEVFADIDRPAVHPSRPYRRDFLLLMDRPAIEKIAAQHLPAQVIAALGARRHCG